MKSDSISEIIRLASILSVAFPLFSYLSRITQAPRTVHIIGALIIVSALSDAVAYFLFAQHQSTVVLFNSYYTILFFLLSWFYYEIISHTKARATLWSGVVIYVISFVLVTGFIQGFFEYQTFMWTITGAIMIIFSISYFLYLFASETPMTGYALLWINSGVLFYFCFNLFLFIMSSYVLTQLDPQISILIWSFHNVNNIIKNILFGLGLTFSQRPTIAETSL
jgi:hypothetical protein